MVGGAIEGIHPVGVIGGGRQVGVGIRERISIHRRDQRSVPVHPIAAHACVIAGSGPGEINLCAAHSCGIQVAGDSRRACLCAGGEGVIPHVKGLAQGVDRRDVHIRTVHCDFEEVIDLAGAGGHGSAAAGFAGGGELDGIGVQCRARAKRPGCGAASAGDVVEDPVGAGKIAFIDMRMTREGNIHAVLFEQAFQTIRAQEIGAGSLIWIV